MEIKLYDHKGKNITGGVAVPEIFNPAKISDKNVSHILYEATKTYLANQRAGAASTKTRGEVSGGSKKPWRQKHTGNARVGSIRSPLWRKGGIIFGPKPRNWRIDMPRNKRRLAAYAAIIDKIQNGAVSIIENFELGEPRTRIVWDMIEKILKDSARPETTNGGLVIFSASKIDPKFQLASRNIPYLEYKISSDLCAYEILKASHVIFTRAGFDAITKRFSEEK